MTSSWIRRGSGRSASRSPWTWPISFLPNRYSMPPKRCGTAVTPGHEVAASRISSPGLFTGTSGRNGGLRGEELDDSPRVAAVFQHAELPVGARSLRQDRVHILDRLSRAKLVDDVVHELEQLEREVAHRHLGLLAEVDQLAIDPVADRPPLVLGDQSRHVLAKTEVARAKNEQLGAYRLHQSGEAHRLLESCRHIADAKLQGRKARPDDAPVGLQPGVAPHPEGT